MPRVDGMRHDPVALRFVADFFAGLNQMKLLLISGWHLVVLPRVIQPLVKSESCVVVDVLITNTGYLECRSRSRFACSHIRPQDARRLVDLGSLAELQLHVDWLVSFSARSTFTRQLAFRIRLISWHTCCLNLLGYVQRIRSSRFNL